MTHATDGLPSGPESTLSPGATAGILAIWGFPGLFINQPRSQGRRLLAPCILPQAEIGSAIGRQSALATAWPVTVPAGRATSGGFGCWRLAATDVYASMLSHQAKPLAKANGQGQQSKTPVKTSSQSHWHQSKPPGKATSQSQQSRPVVKASGQSH